MAGRIIFIFASISISATYVTPSELHVRFFAEHLLLPDPSIVDPLA